MKEKEREKSKGRLKVKSHMRRAVEGDPQNGVAGNMSENSIFTTIKERVL